jgi:pimeloyl-ACP methyl ester carboxylesterase
MSKGFNERTPPLHVDDGGNGGLPVLFVHSFAGNASHWSAQLAHLRPNRRAIAFDLTGHGQSPPPAATTKYSIRLLVRDIENVFRTLKLERFVLVGHSMGAAVAAAYAASHPDSLAGLLLVDPPPAPGAVPQAQISQIISSMKLNPYAVVEEYWKNQLFSGSSPDVQARLLKDLHTLKRAAVVELLADSLQYDSTQDLKRYPGLKHTVVTPQNDAPLSLHNAVPGVSHITMPGTGHWIQLDKPAEFNRALDDFLARVSS